MSFLHTSKKRELLKDDDQYFGFTYKGHRRLMNIINKQCQECPKCYQKMLYYCIDAQCKNRQLLCKNCIQTNKVHKKHKCVYILPLLGYNDIWNTKRNLQQSLKELKDLKYILERWVSDLSSKIDTLKQRIQITSSSLRKRGYYDIQEWVQQKSQSTFKQIVSKVQFLLDQSSFSQQKLAESYAQLNRPRKMNLSLNINNKSLKQSYDKSVKQILSIKSPFKKSLIELNSKSPIKLGQQFFENLKSYRKIYTQDMKFTSISFQINKQQQESLPFLIRQLEHCKQVHLTTVDDIDDRNRSKQVSCRQLNIQMGQYPDGQTIQCDLQSLHIEAPTASIKSICSFLILPINQKMKITIKQQKNNNNHNHDRYQYEDFFNNINLSKQVNLRELDVQILDESANIIQKSNRNHGYYQQNQQRPQSFLASLITNLPPKVQMINIRIEQGKVYKKQYIEKILQKSQIETKILEKRLINLTITGSKCVFKNKKWSVL